MPREPRLDAPGALHHVMGRGIERINIFRTAADRQDFLDRLGNLCREGDLIVYPWALMLKSPVDPDRTATDLQKHEEAFDWLCS